MEVEQVLCMNGGQDNTSYATNSLVQKQAMFKIKPILEDIVTNLYCNWTLLFPENCLKIADLGCSSGPNTLSFVREIIDMIDKTCRQSNLKPPMFQFFLNDLPGNDFNAIFKSWPSFYGRIKREKGGNFGPCLVAGVPGSFYGRLFPDSSLHFVHSSYGLHWRSQIPDALASKSGTPINKGNIYIPKTSSSSGSVWKAYFDLFEKDFMLFLKSRSKELVPGGHMLLTMTGSHLNAHSSKNHDIFIWELLSFALKDMVLEGLIEEAKLNEFNMPYYAPSADEVRQVINREGSFHIQKFETFKMDCDPSSENNQSKMSRVDKKAIGKRVAASIRAISEPILASHFGKEIMDDLFERYADKIVSYLEVERGQYAHMVISVTKKHYKKNGFH